VLAGVLVLSVCSAVGFAPAVATSAELLPEQSSVVTKDLFQGTVGITYVNRSGDTLALVVSNAIKNGPFTWALKEGTLPPGLTLNPNGTITGVPTKDGLYNDLVFTATDKYGRKSDSGPLFIRIAPSGFTMCIKGGPSERVLNVALEVVYSVGGEPKTTQKIAITIPAKSTEEAAGKVALETLTTALENSFNVTQSAAACGYRIDVMVKPGVVLSDPFPNFGKPEKIGFDTYYQRRSGKLTILVGQS
jgi:hypothetical protein